MNQNDIEGYWCYYSRSDGDIVTGGNLNFPLTRFYKKRFYAVTLNYFRNNATNNFILKKIDKKYIETDLSDMWRLFEEIILL
jgi:hypothetical protein